MSGNLATGSFNGTWYGTLPVSGNSGTTARLLAGVIAGAGALARLGELASELGFARTLLVSDPGMVATEMTGRHGIPPEQSATGLLARIDALGGTLAAIEAGVIQREIQELTQGRPGGQIRLVLHPQLAEAFVEKQKAIDTVDIALELPPIEQPGRYTLKFDLVNEGVEWFEKCGSPTTIAALRVD